MYLTPGSWPQLPISPLEHVEKLEQLRLIEAGIHIDTLEVEGAQFSVDTPEQLEQVRASAASPKLRAPLPPKSLGRSNRGGHDAGSH